LDPYFSDGACSATPTESGRLAGRRSYGIPVLLSVGTSPSAAGMSVQTHAKAAEESPRCPSTPDTAPWSVRSPKSTGDESPSQSPLPSAREWRPAGAAQPAVGGAPVDAPDSVYLTPGSDANGGWATLLSPGPPLPAAGDATAPPALAAAIAGAGIGMAAGMAAAAPMGGCQSGNFQERAPVAAAVHPADKAAPLSDSASPFQSLVQRWEIFSQAGDLR
jgi:hypothetical protein